MLKNRITGENGVKSVKYVKYEIFEVEKCLKIENS